MRGSFALLDFDSNDDPTVAYVEFSMGARYVEQSSQVNEYEHVFDVLFNKSVSLRSGARDPMDQSLCQQCTGELRTDATVGEMIEVRDSKDPDGPVLRFTVDEIAAWLDGAKRGEFDDLPWVDK